MTPCVPGFRSLNIADRPAVAAIVNSFPPCSNFNYTNLQAWGARIAFLHSNLAVQFSDYVTGAPFFSFIGRCRTMETAKHLLELARDQFSVTSPSLHLVPECAAQELCNEGFAVTADDGASDYIYSVDHIANMHKWKGHSSSRRIRQFLERHSNYSIRHASLATVDADEFRALFAIWAARKGHASPQDNHEYVAFERFLRSTDPRIETVGVYVSGRLVGFSAFERTHDGTALVHFSKADYTVHGGVSDLLIWEEARVLQAHNVRYYNWGPDLGLPALQQSKKKYAPSHFIKPFTVQML